MENKDYLELYLSESREHLRELSAGLLRLEEEGRGPALEACFRAAHTLKGMSAAMGFDAAAGTAHRLEDLLSSIRSGSVTVDGGVVDEVLSLADALEAAVHAATADVEEGAGKVAPTGPTGESEFDLSAEALLEDEEIALPDPASAITVRILIEPAAPLKGARALLLRKAVSEVAPVLWTIPAEVGDEFDGDLRIGLGEGADREAVEAAIRRAGEVRAFHWLVRQLEAGPTAAAPASALGLAPLEGRHVRVERRHLDALAERVAEMTVLRARLRELSGSAGDGTLMEMSDSMGRLVDELQETVLAARMIPVEEVFDRFPRLVRDTARRLGREVEFVMEGKDIRIDRAILEEMRDPLLHLLRNAVDHGIEAPARRRAVGKRARGRLLLAARRERAGVMIRVEDDGAGISRERVLERALQTGLIEERGSEISDDQLMRLLARPGFSTADRVTEHSGRGVGLDVVIHRVRVLGGSIGLETREGRGTAFTIRLPLSIALAHALRVRLAGQEFLIPLTHVTEVVALGENVDSAGGRELLRLRDERIPLRRLGAAMGNNAESESTAVVYGSGELRGALAVEELVGHEQVVVRPYDPPHGSLRCFTGVTLLGDGRPALVLDPTSVS